MIITAETRLLESIKTSMEEVAKTLKKYENLKSGKFNFEEFRDRKI